MRYRRIFDSALILLLIGIVGMTYWIFIHKQNDQSGLMLSDFYFLHRETRLEEVFDRLGTPSRTLGSGITRYQYDLADGRVVELITNYGQLEAWILEKDGIRTDYFEIVGEAMTCEPGKESIETVPTLIQSLKDDDPVMRKEAAKSLGCIGAEAQEAIPALVQTLGDKRIWVRDAAAWALGQIGRAAVPKLIQSLESEDASVRSAAASALGHAGSEAEDAIPALCRALGDEDRMVRKAAIWALGQIGPESISMLTRALESEDISVRKSAALALGEVGPEAVEAIPALIEVLEDNSREVRIAASIALGDITGQGCCRESGWWREWWEAQQ